MIEIEVNKDNLLNFIANIRNEDEAELRYFIKDNLSKNFVDICLKNKEKTYFLRKLKLLQA